MAAPDHPVNLTDALSRFDETTGCQMLLLEPAGVPDTGDVDSELAHDAEWL